MFNLLIVFIDVIFWLFRVVVTISYNVGAQIGFEPINYTGEIITLFLALFSIILIAKRKLIGGILFLLTYGAYFGVYLYQSIVNQETANYASVFIAGIAILLAFISFASVGITGSGKTSHAKTDWFFKNNDIQRKKDSRDDTNQYKF